MPPGTPAAAEVSVVLPTPAPGAAMSPAGAAGLPEWAGFAGISGDNRLVPCQALVAPPAEPGLFR
jgi:hypothetical protein